MKKIIPKNTICLWYNKDALAAARFYAKTFPNSKVGAVHKAPGDFPGASFFLERRRWYLAYANQFFVKLALDFIYEVKCLLNSVCAEQFRDR